MSRAYDFVGLDSIQMIRRILEIATVDTLGLDNSDTRSRPIVSAAVAAAKLLETGELEGRVAALELTLGTAHQTQAGPASVPNMIVPVWASTMPVTRTKRTSGEPFSRL